MSNVQFKLPDVGEGLTEADIVSWRVSAGDTVIVNQVIVEIETAKSLVELPCPTAGTVASLLVEEGQTVPVGSPIIDITPEDSSAGASAPDGSAGEEASGVEEGGSEGGGATLVGYGAREETGLRGRLGRRRARKSGGTTTPEKPGQDSAPEPAADDAVEPSAVPSGTRAGGTGSGGRGRAKPMVRKKAKDAGIDLEQVPGTGSRGEVTRKDLEAFIAGGGAASSSAPVATTQLSSEDEDTWTVPLKGVRKMTAQAMVASAFTAPHVTEFLDVDVSRTLALVKRSKAENPDRPVSALAVLSRAVCWALRRTPEINARLDGEQIVVGRRVNLGIAAATDRGLVVPVVHDAQNQSIGDLARNIRELAVTARDGKLSPAQQAGGTITITNVGVFGVDSGTPIISPGQSAIVAFGQIRKRAWVVEDDQLAVRPVTTLSVSADHRVVDGAEISRFLKDVGAALEDPSVMLV